MNRNVRKNIRYKKAKSNIPLLLLIVVILAAILLVIALFRKPSDGGGSTDTSAPVGSDTVTDTSEPSGTTAPEDTTAPDDTTASDTVSPDTTASDTTEAAATDAPATSAPPTTEPPVTTSPVTTPPVTTSPVTTPPETDAPVTTGGDEIVTSAPTVTDIYPGTPTSYANQLPASAPVGNDYFSDALFIGDSRTVGFQSSTDTAATFYAKVSLNIGQLNKQNDSSRFININTQNGVVKCNVYEALEYNHSFGKVYLRMGLSELGWDTNSFFNTYKGVVEYIKAKIPGAKIYIESVIPVTAGRSNQNLYGVTNKEIWDYNRRLSALADECGVYFVNVAEYFTLEDGTLPVEYAPDGVHMYGPCYRRWLEYLATHTAP